ncbi:MAG: LysM peptidoglycan-binding domain-containing protein [Verrucomicrobiae bacterium]|nr:LysM peptidoglycan-binding domain-containing protein [Verrucomicrobiae bacterium]
MLVIVWVAAIGCRHAVTDPQQGAAYQQARKCADTGDWKTAAAFYRAALDEHPRFAQAHLDLALLAAEKLHDPITALYHYRRYLELEPNSEKRRVVEELIERAKLLLASRLAQPAVDTAELVRLQQQNTALAAEVAVLKAKLADYEVTAQRASQQETNTVALPSPTTPAATKPRVHVVAKGDTLHSIAMRYYGTRAAWEKIYQANRDILPNKDQLKIGQQLVIP